MNAKEINLQAWKKRIDKPAGITAQLLMAPQHRKDELLSYKHIAATKTSAVLILLFLDNDNKLKVLLTLRAQGLSKHKGQISFPGGRMDNSDVNLRATALREAYEEVGLRNNNLEIIGPLSPLVIPITDFIVYPIVAYCPMKPTLRRNPDEVQKIIIVPLEDILNNKNIKSKVFESSSSDKSYSAPYFDVEGIEIWGATAMILAEALITLFPQSSFANEKATENALKQVAARL